MAELAGKTAWVTGAGTGIGRAIAIALAKEGMRLALTGRREGPLRETSAMLAAETGRDDATVLPGDLTNAEDVTRMAASLLDSGPDILVNNAGVNVKRRYLHQLDPAAIRTIVDGNLTAPFLTTTAVLPAMRARGGGLIVQIASMAGKQVSFLSGPGYIAAKHGFVALSAAVNQENGIHGIRSTCICPGEVATPILDQRPVPPSAEERARMLQPEDLAAMVVFVAKLPPHVLIAEMLTSPTWNRNIAPQAQAVAAMP